MHVVVTRPVRDAEPFKSRLEEFGCRVMLAPLFEVVARDIAADVLDGAAALIVTSRNALSALAASPALPSAVDLPIYVVGPGTAAAAQKMGFKQIIEGAGRAEDLVPVLAANRPLGGRLIYLRGDVLAFDLEAALAESGVNIEAVLAYRAVAAETLPAEVIKALQTGGIDAVTLMSPRTARIWARLVAALSPPVQLSGLAFLCLSERVGQALGQSVKADNIWVASHPNVEEMLALVKRLAASSKAE
ncbi:uroporphyrinogen-III synthase [Hyphomicrobium sp.]|jgi:uroporphyrinogen-III synthase|uniref:uroporphyrinogen-III synthase n=1 Tax=Hyphomicrobium sp. TaxID=82 RepID=UPI003563418E